MAIDPRLLGAVNLASSLFSSTLQGASPDGCPTVGQQSLSASLSINASLGGNLGVQGQFQLLATSGGGQVGAGLRSLASISDQVRINGGITGTPVPSTSVEGSNFVLAQVGIDSTALNNASQYNASITVGAQTQASQIYNSVAQGQFTSDQITSSFQPLQNAAQLLSSIFTANPLAQGSNFGSMCGASPYAVDLIQFAPKYKFLFIIQLEFDPAFQSEVLSSIDPAFVVKSSTRPNVEFEYEEVNMYNFRTKIPKRTIYQPMTMKFYDDDKNNAMQFYTTYLKLMSPIATVNPGMQDPLNMFDQVGGGLGFNGQTKGVIQPQWGSTIGQDYAGSLGSFGTNPNTRNILRRITLFHVYKQGRMMNVFNFYNPKITLLELDDVDMAESSGNEVSFQFTYDSLYIIPGFRIFGNQTQYNLQTMTNEGQYPFGASPGLVSNDGGNVIKDGSRGAMAFGENVENGFGSSSPSIIPAVSSATNSSSQSSSIPTNPSLTQLQSHAQAVEAFNTKQQADQQQLAVDNSNGLSTTNPTQFQADQAAVNADLGTNIASLGY